MKFPAGTFYRQLRKSGRSQPCRFDLPSFSPALLVPVIRLICRVSLYRPSAALASSLVLLWCGFHTHTYSGVRFPEQLLQSSASSACALLLFLLAAAADDEDSHDALGVADVISWCGQWFVSAHSARRDAWRKRRPIASGISRGTAMWPTTFLPYSLCFIDFFHLFHFDWCFIFIIIILFNIIIFILLLFFSFLLFIIRFSLFFKYFI